MSAKGWQEQQLFLVDIDNEEDAPMLTIKNAKAICRENHLPLKNLSTVRSQNSGYVTYYRGMAAISCSGSSDILFNAYSQHWHTRLLSETFCSCAITFNRSTNSVDIRNAHFAGSESRLKLLRKQCGLTQEALANESGVSLNTIRAYERKSKDLNKAQFGIVIRLAKALKCEVTDLFE